MRPIDFRWNEWNLGHATGHGCTVREIERVVLNNDARRLDAAKWITIGRGQGGRPIRVIFLMDPDGSTAFVIHAMPVILRHKK